MPPCSKTQELLPVPALLQDSRPGAAGLRGANSAQFLPKGQSHGPGAPGCLFTATREAGAGADKHRGALPCTRLWWEPAPSCPRGTVPTEPLRPPRVAGSLPAPLCLLRYIGCSHHQHQNIPRVNSWQCQSAPVCTVLTVTVFRNRLFLEEKKKSCLLVCSDCRVTAAAPPASVLLCIGSLKVFMHEDYVKVFIKSYK